MTFFDHTIFEQVNAANKSMFDLNLFCCGLLTSDFCQLSQLNVCVSYIFLGFGDIVLLSQTASDFIKFPIKEELSCFVLAKK